ncbi:MAG: TPM domain-containing protein [Variovorax sp.]
MSRLSIRLARLWRHRWFGRADVRKVLPEASLNRLAGRIAASEQRHSGQIRICVEAALPDSYLWRSATPRQRALTLFGKLRVWDTEHNNGVLIYLMLADRAVEIIADRGIDHHVTDTDWAVMTARMSDSFKAGRFEDGLTQALEEVSALLMTHYVLDAEAPRGPNELPDAVVVL